MAITIKEHKIVDNNRRALLKYVLKSDGTTNVANTVLVNTANLRFALNTTGQIMTGGVNRLGNYKTTIKRVTGQGKIGGYIALQWQGDSNSEIVTLGTGRVDYDFQSMGDGATIANIEANSNGQILITTVGAAAGDAYTFFVDLRKDASTYDAGQSADPVAFNQGPADGL